MKGITDYGFYTVQCTFVDVTAPGGPTPRFPNEPSAGYLHVPGAVRSPGRDDITFDSKAGPGSWSKTGITQWTLDENVPFAHHHFHWLFVEAGEPDHFYIVNRRSGLCLMVPGPPDRPQQLIQTDYDPGRDARFRFVLEIPEAESTVVSKSATAAQQNGSFRLLSYFSGNNIIVHGGIAENKQPILSYPDLEASVLDRLGHGTFKLQRVGSAEHPTIPERKNDKLSRRQLPKMTSLDDDLPPSFPRSGGTVLAEELIPFFLINDPGLAHFRQSEVSPYYTLRHSRRWDKALDRQFDGQTRRETTETIVVGITQFDASSFTDTFKWSVEATAQAGYKAGGFSGSLKITGRIEKAVEETRQQSTERREDRTRTEEVTYPDLGFPYRVVTWVPVDVYDLCRRNEQQPIKTWTVTRKEEDVTDIFPVRRPTKKPAN